MDKKIWWPLEKTQFARRNFAFSFRIFFTRAISSHHRSSNPSTATAARVSCSCAASLTTWTARRARSGKAMRPCQLPPWWNRSFWSSRKTPSANSLTLSYLGELNDVTTATFSKPFEFLNRLSWFLAILSIFAFREILLDYHHVTLMLPLNMSIVIVAIKTVCGTKFWVVLNWESPDFHWLSKCSVFVASFLNRVPFPLVSILFENNSRVRCSLLSSGRAVENFFSSSI